MLLIRRPTLSDGTLGDGVKMIRWRKIRSTMVIDLKTKRVVSDAKSATKEPF